MQQQQVTKVTINIVENKTQRNISINLDTRENVYSTSMEYANGR